MRGRLYYTAKAKKSGKVMIKTHPCSRLCFCKCWTCFKEVSSTGVRGHRRGGAAALGLRLCPGLRQCTPGPQAHSVCSGATVPSSLSSHPACLAVENAEELEHFWATSRAIREACSGPLLVLVGRTRENTVGCYSLPGLGLSKRWDRNI